MTASDDPNFNSQQPSVVSKRSGSMMFAIWFAFSLGTICMVEAYQTNSISHVHHHYHPVGRPLTTRKFVKSPLFLSSSSRKPEGPRGQWTQTSLFSSQPPLPRSMSSASNDTGPSPPLRPSKFSKRILFSRLLLGGLVFGIGYRVGVARPEAAVMKKLVESSKSGTLPASPSRRLTVFVLGSIVTGLLLRDAWRMVPSWAKPSIMKRVVTDIKRVLGMTTRTTAFPPVGSASNHASAKSGSSKTDSSSSDLEEGTQPAINTSTETGADSAPGAELSLDEDISDFGTFATKLNGLLNVAKRRMSSDTMEQFNLQASFFALLALLQQQKANSANDRDETYATCGTNVTSTDLYGLDEWMDLADAAYNEFAEEEEGMTLPRYLQKKGYDLIKHDVTVMPGYLGHYVALHQEEKVALIGVKGTSSLEDLITDMCGAAISYELEEGPFIANGPTTIKAHEGVLLSSRRLADDLQPLVEKLLIPAGFKIVVVGHSLGAAAAALLAVLLQSRIPTLRPSGWPNRANRLHAYAFASPPTLDLQSAQACESFVTTIVNNCDVIPRSNAGPVLVTLELLKTINQKLLEEQNDQDGDGTSIQLSGLSGWTSTLKFIQSLRKQGKFNEEDSEPPLISSEELADAIDQALEKVGFNLEDPDQLYVPGNVVLMYDLWEEESRYYREQSVTQGSNEDEYDYSADRAVVAEPTAKVLRYLEFDGRMVEDHLAPSYKSSLRALCRQFDASAAVET